MILSQEIIEIVANIFINISNKEYVVLRFLNINNIKPGNDIDILCKNAESIAESILSILKKNIIHTYHISTTKKKNVHIDIMKDKSIYLRFDLIESFKHYKKISVTDGYVNEVIKRRIKSNHNINNLKFVIFCPQEEDELALRYLEYIENYDKRVEKSKHYKYIYKRILVNPENSSFLKILGHVLEPRSITINKESQYKFHFLYLIQLLLRKLFNIIDRLNKLEK